MIFVYNILISPWSRNGQFLFYYGRLQ